MNTKVKYPTQDFVPGGSRKRRNLRTFSLQMAREIKLDLERAKRLKELRGADKDGRHGKWSQNEIANLVGVADGRSVQHWEQGKGISQGNLEAVAECYSQLYGREITENWIRFGDEKPEGARSQLDRMDAKLDALGEIEAKLDDLSDLLLELELTVARLARRKPRRGDGEVDAASNS